MPTSTLTSKGQTTIPQEIREFLQLHPGDRLDYTIETDGRVILRPATVDTRTLKGLLQRTDGRMVSLEEMQEAIIQGALGESE
jgi:antitoxin PrlF